MTEDGNHGGASPEETGSALFMYSKTKRLHDSTLQQGERHAVSQVDLVPTLALLLGIPIPFGSLGSVLPDLLYGHDDDIREETLTRALDLNVAQVWTYLKTYSSFAGRC
jgi:phosphatidylinositol glycan class O